MLRLAAWLLAASITLVRAQNTSVPIVAPDLVNFPSDFAGGVEFATTAGTQQAMGAACIVSLSDSFQAYVVSARQLLGPNGGFATQTAAADVPKFVTGITIHGFRGGDKSYAITPLLVPAKKVVFDGGDPVDDLAIFQLKDSAPQDQAVELLDKLPAKGETVYLIARAYGAELEVHAMKVYDTRGWLECVFDNDKTDTSNATGAPALNADGKCIGVYSGQRTIDGHLHAFFIPSPLIIATIKNAPPPASP